MAFNSLSELPDEPSIDSDKLSYEIFSILESKFLFGYGDDQITNDKLSWIPKQLSPIGVDGVDFPPPPPPPPPLSQPAAADVDREGVNAAKNQRGKICILSIDGGGMRGIISGKTLAYLEQALKLKTGDRDARIADYFDVAAGSGVGGIFAAMLFATKDHSRPLHAAEDTWRFLTEQGSKIYRSRSSSGYGLGWKNMWKGNMSGSATSNLEKLMKEKFNVKGMKGLTLKDTLKPVLIPCYDLSTTAPFLFSRADALEKDGFDFMLWQVCRATSAEPGVFEPVCMNSVDGSTRCVAVDGGLAMSNPTAAAITHVLHNKQEFPFVRGVEDIMVVSIGSGLLLDCSYNHEQVKGWKSKQWARPMGRIAADGYTDLVDHAVAMSFHQCRNNCYVRVQANGSNFGRCGPNVDTDSSPNNVKMLVEIGDEMLKQKNVESVLFGGKKICEWSNYEKLDWIAEQLVHEHKMRRCRIAPTVVLKQAPSKPS